MKRVCILGCGRLADIVAQAIARGEIDELELAGVYSRSRDKTINFAKKVSCRAAESFEELMKVRPDYVVEAATGKALREYAVPALATNGVEHTPVKVETGDRVSFQTELAGDFGKALIYTELGTVGPDMAAWSVLRILQRLNSRIVF
ncbi:MAG: hypothetical protein Q4C52_02920 [Eubacteriales bacterium]|nr:hypothetical protein [Eubacteriales bacterium]